MSIYYSETIDRRTAAGSWPADPQASRGGSVDSSRAETLQLLGRLTSEISHDFNNYLQAIASTLELIETRAALGQTGEVEKQARRGLAMVDRGRTLVARLLEFSSPRRHAPAFVDVNLTVTSMVPLLRMAVGVSVDVRLNLASAAVPVQCDAAQLESVILNLAVNARDAMPQGGILAIETANAMVVGECGALRPGWYTSVCVADTGTGMDADTLGRAFEAYFTTKPRGLGTGLGLSTARGFARGIGGDVEVFSAPGKGAAVTLYLPCAEPASA